jgi:PPIC-type PPIASE domain
LNSRFNDDSRLKPGTVLDGACPFIISGGGFTVRCNHLVSFLLAGMTPFLAPVQSAQEPSRSGATAQPAASEEAAQPIVGPDDAVITINGFCNDPVVEGSACKSVVSRAQFDMLADALEPGMPLPLRLKVANAYARNMRMAATAQARGLDRTQAFEEEMRFARLQLLAQDLDRALKTEANNISDDELGNYYEKNRSYFEQAAVARIFIPHSSRLAPGANGEAQKKAAAEAMTKLAADLRARAVQGEDMDKLQIEAYSQAGIDRVKADTKLEKVRRDALPPQHDSVMDLKPGEVSEVFSDPEGAHFVYKMIAKETLTLEEAKPEIRSAISTERYRDSMKAFQGNVVFSDAYFNPSGKSVKPPVRGHKTVPH